MNTVKIAKLCNEIEDIACDISQQTMNDIISAESRMIFDKAKEITAEITAQPKTNADRIRQMSDEELAKILCFADCEVLCPANHEHCNGDCCGHFLRWLKQEVSENAAD